MFVLSRQLFNRLQHFHHYVIIVKYSSPKTEYSSLVFRYHKNITNTRQDKSKKKKMKKQWGWTIHHIPIQCSSKDVFHFLYGGRAGSGNQERASLSKCLLLTPFCFLNYLHTQISHFNSQNNRFSSSQIFIL